MLEGVALERRGDPAGWGAVVQQVGCGDISEDWQCVFIIRLLVA